MCSCETSRLVGSSRHCGGGLERRQGEYKRSLKARRRAAGPHAGRETLVTIEARARRAAEDLQAEVETGSGAGVFAFAVAGAAGATIAGAIVARAMSSTCFS